MRDVYLDKVFAVVLFLLLCLYYRWLEWSDSKKRLACREQKRREERKGSTPLPAELRWSGTVPESVSPRERSLAPRFSTSRGALGSQSRQTDHEHRSDEVKR